MEGNIIFKTPMKEVDLSWERIPDRRQHSMKDDLRKKMTSDKRQPSVEKGFN